MFFEGGRLILTCPFSLVRLGRLRQDRDRLARQGLLVISHVTHNLPLR